MEGLMATAIGVLVACGIYLLLRARTFPVILGISLLSYATNMFLLAMGKLSDAAAPIVRDDVNEYVDPLPQALVLTAIVIGFGMASFLVVLALRASVTTGTDHVDGEERT